MKKQNQDPISEVVMLLAVIAKRGIMQADFIRELSLVGFGPTRIAEIIGTTANTVSVVLNKSKKKAKK